MVRVEPLRLEWIEALIDGDAVFAERFGIAMLVHCGFTRTATIADPDQGVDEDVWRWELPLG